jgi:hypothetical protein
VRSPWVTAIPNQKVLDMANYLSTDLPLQILEKISSLPYYGSEKKRSQVQEMQKLAAKMKAMQAIFFHFMNSEFIYESSNSDHIWSIMSAKDKATFPFDIRMVNW